MAIPVDTARLRKALTALRDAGPQGLTKDEFRRRITAAGDGDTISAKTVERCVARLEEDGATILRELRGNQRAYILGKPPRWDSHVSGEGKLALRLANLILSQSGTLLWEEKMTLIEKAVEEHMSSRDRRLFDTLSQRVQVSGGAGDSVESPSAEVLEPILRAMTDGRLVKVTYQAAWKDQPEEVEVVPCTLTHDLFSGGAYLLAWVPSRRHVRQLRLNRLSRVQVLAGAGVVPDPVRVERAMLYQIGGWISEGEPFEVTVRVKGKGWTRALLDAPPALPHCRLEPDRDFESVVVRFKANREEGALRWVAQFGEAAELLGPEDLRSRIRQNLESALAAYSD